MIEDFTVGVESIVYSVRLTEFFGTDALSEFINTKPSVMITL